MALLADLALDPRAERDLRWYFTQADGEMGLRSNFGAMAAQLESGVSGGTAIDFEERMFDRLGPAGEARRVSRALEQIGGGRRWALVQCFGPRARSLPGLGVVAPLALYTAAAPREHRRSQTDRPIEEWLVRLCHRCASPAALARASRKQRRAEKATAADRAALLAIRSEAEAILRTVIGAYLSAVRRGRR